MNGVAHLVHEASSEEDTRQKERTFIELWKNACGFEHLDGGREPFELKVI